VCTSLSGIGSGVHTWLLVVGVTWYIAQHRGWQQMASHGEWVNLHEQKSVFCSQCRSEITQVDNFSKESEGENKHNLQNLQEDIEKLNELLKSAICTSVKEVILHEIVVTLGKINRLTEICKRKIENDACWSEVMKRSANLFVNNNKQYYIPVINNQHQTFINDKLPDWTKVESQQVRANIKPLKCMDYKSKHKIVLLGDSHSSGMAINLRHNLNDGYKVQGLIQQRSDLSAILNSKTHDISELTKNDVIIVWGETRNVSKDESNKGLTEIRKFMENNKNTNIMIIHLPTRLDLEPMSCINQETKVFN
jgi:hypothetical protein